MLVWSDTLLILLGALAIDAVVGDPSWLWRRLPHPVALMGALIDALDRALNREDRSAIERQAAGVASITILVSLSALVGWTLETALRYADGGEVAIAVVASLFIAQRSLYEHVARVRAAFDAGGLASAREAVSLIVGRDPSVLDESGVCRAAIESCAENFSDGVVAPVLWFALFGLPGLLIYKAINTADSMIGHRRRRHDSFGWAAARLDDAVNIVPARLSGALVAAVAPVVGGSIESALTIMWRDAGLHRSPNAGWPESAMAGALGIALAGPRRYAERTVDDPFLNRTGRKAAIPGDISHALHVLVAACILQAALYAVPVLLF